jgi:hypothetical protein
MSRIEDEFRSAGALRGGVLLLRPHDAIRMVQRCRERQVRVLGIDGFFLTDCTTQPSIEQSIDLSDFHGGRHFVDCWERAETFLEERKKTDLFFEIVIEDHK